MIRRLSAVLCMLVFFLTGAAFGAELIVVASTVPGLSVGQIIQHNAPIDIPSGASLTVVAQNGQSTTLTGPHSGVPGIGAGAQVTRGVVNSLSSLFKGSNQESTALGVMRSAPPTAPSDPWVIDTGRTGDHCVPALGESVFWRSKTDQPQTLVLKHMGVPRAKAETKWPEGENLLNWPKDVPHRDGATYLLRIKDTKTARKVILHVAPQTLKSVAHRAAWMAEQGCRKQAIQLLSTIR